MIYPDEEKITYSYNLGGQLEKVHGYKSYGYDYVSKIGYDKFEQRTYLKYCNGAETFYTYDPQRCRLQNLTVNSGGNTIMDNAYTYDAVSNVLSVVNGASVPQSGKAGGQMAHAYTYDALYRLVSATGTYTGADNKTASYTLAMGYDNMHRITSKRQILIQNNVQFNGTLNAGYDLSYTYGTDTGKKFQLANVKDVNYRTEETPSESENVNNNHAYEYDANGNLVYVNTSRTKKDGVADEKTTERKLKWDEENRLLASDDNGFVTNYWYDADGERTVKTSGESDQVYVNSEFAGGRTNTAKFSLYVSPYLVANQGGRYTKHIYIGSQRVVSKIGDFDSYGSDPRRIQYAGSETDGLSVDYKQKYVQQLQAIKDNYATFAVPYNGEDNNDYVDGKGFCCNDGSLEAAQARAMARTVKNNFQEGDAYEKMQFYYHPDHLGSSSYITNLDGEVVQHIEYVPFGEVFVEERNNIWNTPYLFNVKEFDEETGLYYYGARYYDPKVSLWISVDQEQEAFPNITTYCYTRDNPVVFVDADGNAPQKSRIEYRGNGIFGINIKNLNAPTRNDFLRRNNDPKNWRPGEIGINTEIAKIQKIFNYSSFSTNSDYSPVGIDPENTNVKIMAPTAKSTGLADRRYKSRYISTIGAGNMTRIGANTMIVLNFAIEIADKYILFSMNNDYDAVTSQTVMVNSAIQKVLSTAREKLIPQRYCNENDLGAIANYVFQGQNSSKDKNIQILGNQILKRMGRYDKKNKRYKPLIEE